MCRNRYLFPIISCLLIVSTSTSAIRTDMATLESWCGSPPTYTTPLWDNLGNINDRCGYAMGSCYCLTRLSSNHRAWVGGSYTCTFNPTVPTGVIGHLALVHSQWAGDRLYALLATGGGCPWVGLTFTEPEDGRTAGWYHEPYQGTTVDYRTWAVAHVDVPTPWASGQPAGWGGYAACLSSGRLHVQLANSGHYWICQYRYNFSTPRRNTFYTTEPTAVDRWPVAAARIQDAKVKKYHMIAECAQLCTSDWTCMGFAVNKRTAHCVTAYEVTHSSAVEARVGYVLYERVYVL